MPDAKNKDILKLISEILEYTENSTPSDPPPSDPPPSDTPTSSRSKCACSAGPCRDGSSSDGVCPDGSPKKTCNSSGADGEDCIFNPDCHTCECSCKDEGGSCGDDVTGCEPYSNGSYDIEMCSCADGTQIFCPKCPPTSEPPTPSPTASPSPSKCNCFDCGLWDYEKDDSCYQETCKCSYGEENPDCWNCPDTNTPSETCDTDDCFCDSGINCEFCYSFGDDCVNQQIQLCDQPGCFITCGHCAPKETPSSSPTDTEVCPCDCSDYESMSACEAARRTVPGKWHCESNPCSCDEAYTNPDCTDLKEGDPSPTPTPTKTCPLTCSEHPWACYNPGSQCAGCAKNSSDYCLNCVPNGHTCQMKGCPIFYCDLCDHEPKLCYNGMYPDKEDCDLALSLQFDPSKRCERCDIPHKCSDGTPPQEECYCIVTVPSDSPTPSSCNCDQFPGYVNVGTCGKAGAKGTYIMNCPPPFKDDQVTCDICNPPPTPSCDCTDFEDSAAPCFNSSDSCDSYAQNARTGENPKDCVCSPRLVRCPDGDGEKDPTNPNSKTCYCASCFPLTPTPDTPTPSITPSCPTNCCKTPEAARSLGLSKCNSRDGCCIVEPFINSIQPGCPQGVCYGAEVQGSALVKKHIATLVGAGNENCVYRGLQCTGGETFVCSLANGIDCYARSFPGGSDGPHIGC